MDQGEFECGEFECIAATVVVVARFHNPSVLNPDFLQRWKIVPEDWEAVETLTTRPFAQTRFDTGVVVAVEHHRLSIYQPAKGLPLHTVCEIAGKYVAQLFAEQQLQRLLG